MLNEYQNDVTRREFVKSSAAAFVPMIAGGTGALLMPRAVRAAKADPLKIGLIGCGGRGTGAAVQALTADEGAVLTAMADMFSDRIESSHSALTRHFGDRDSEKLRVAADSRFTGFEGYKRVIDSDVDVVLLTAPPGFRPLHFARAVDAGKHIFTEKPMAVDAPGVRATMKAALLAKQKSLSVVGGFCWRYADAERETFRRIREGTIGDIVTVHSTYHGGTLGQKPRQPEWTDMEWQLRNWWHFTWLSGDHLVEQACHSVDRLSWAMGDTPPLRCTALGGRAARKGAESGHVFDHFTVIYEYEGGRRAFLTCRQIDNCPGDNSDYIYGTKGSAIVNGFTPLHDIKDTDGKTVWKYESPASGGKDMYQNEHDALFASIRSTKPMNDGVQMCNSTLMAIMGRMAAYTGQTITWEQAMMSSEDLTPPKLEMGEIAMPLVAVPGQTKFV